MTNEEKILEMLGTINDRIGRMETTQTQMQAAQAQMNDRLGRVEATQTQMQEDLTGVKEDLAGVKATQTQMQEDLTGVKEDLAGVKATQTQMQEDITRINVTLEVEVSRDIKLLAEGHAGIVEKLEELDELRESLEETRVKVDAIHAVTMENIRDIKVLKRSRS